MKLDWALLKLKRKVKFSMKVVALDDMNLDWALLKLKKKVKKPKQEN